MVAEGCDPNTQKAQEEGWESELSQSYMVTHASIREQDPVGMTSDVLLQKKQQK